MGCNGRRRLSLLSLDFFLCGEPLALRVPVLCSVSLLPDEELRSLLLLLPLVPELDDVEVLLVLLVSLPDEDDE